MLDVHLEIPESAEQDSSMGQNLIGNRASKSKLVDIRVIGVGGGGCNSVNRMVKYEEETGEKLELVEYILANTDIQSLERNSANTKIKLGKEGVGAGMEPDKARDAALFSKEELKRHISGAQMLFIVAAMGGGTGTGASPEIAKIAKEEGILTVAVVTTPFRSEGRKKLKIAEEGIAKLVKEVDTIIIVENEKLLSTSMENELLSDSFRRADDIVKHAVRAVVEVIESEDFINTDFADVQKILRNKGYAHMGVGIGRGENALLDAMGGAIQSPLISKNITGFSSCLYQIKCANSTLKTLDFEEISAFIRDCGDGDAEIIWGYSEPDEMAEDEIMLTIIAAGFDEDIIGKYLLVNKETEAKMAAKKSSIFDSLRASLNINKSAPAANTAQESGMSSELLSAQAEQNKEALKASAKPTQDMVSNAKSLVIDNVQQEEKIFASGATQRDDRFFQAELPEKQDRFDKVARPETQAAPKDDFDTLFGGERVDLSSRAGRNQNNVKDFGDGLLLDSHVKIDRSKYE